MDNLKNQCIYNKQFSWVYNGDNTFGIELTEGDYTIVFSTKGEVDFYVTAYFEYKVSKEHPVFEISNTILELYVGEEAKLSVDSDPADLEFNVKWRSDDSSVASVDKNGKVTAKKVGYATITATVNGEKYACDVYVFKRFPTYKKVVTEAKKYQTKAIKFKQIDVGYESRLLEQGTFGSRFYKNRGYGYVVMLQSYIEIKKKDYGADMNLYYSGEDVIVDSRRWVNTFTKVKFYTNNRKTTYKITSYNKKYSYKKGVYTNKFIWKAKLSDNDQPSMDQLNKLIKIFEHKNVNVKLFNNSSYSILKLPETVRKHELKLFQTYKKLLKLYD